MKKLFLLFAFFGLVAVTSNAQTCPKAKKASASLDKTEKVCTKTAAAKAASLDESIEKTVCAKSGKVSYHQKSVCAKSGNVSTKEVQYCDKSRKFVNVSPSEAGAKKAACTKGKKACTKSKAACTKGASASGKVCTKSAAAKLASMDENIEKRVCSKSGTVSYYQKSVCAKSGNVNMQEVQYCDKSQKFVNTSPSEAGAKATCTKGKKACTKSKAACTKGAKAVKASEISGKKTACAKGKKACCSKSKKTACTKGAKAVKAANVSVEK